MVFRINSQVSFLTSYMIGLLFISVFISTTLIILSVLLHCCVVFLTSPGLCQAHSYHMCFAIAILSTLPVSWEICIQDKKTIFRNGHGTDWFQIGKRVYQGCILWPCLTPMQSTACEMPDWMTHELESRLLEEILITSNMQMISL